MGFFQLNVMETSWSFSLLALHHLPSKGLLSHDGNSRDTSLRRWRVVPRRVPLGWQAMPCECGGACVAVTVHWASGQVTFPSQLKTPGTRE